MFSSSHDTGVGMANTSNTIFPDTRLRNASHDERDLPLHTKALAKRQEGREVAHATDPRKQSDELFMGICCFHPNGCTVSRCGFV